LVQTLITSIEKTSNRIEEVDRYTVKSKNQLFERIKQIDMDLLEVVSGGNTDPRKVFESFEATIQRLEVMYDQLEKNFIDLRQKVVQELKTVTTVNQERDTQTKKRLQEMYEDTGKFASQFTHS
jgi:acyl carrier protein phosphodiesterase